MFCTNCGEENRNDRKFCTNCGAELLDYTKPKENLIMPEELTKVNKQKRILSNWILGLLISSVVLFTVSLITLLLSYFVKESAKLPIAIISFACIFLFIVVWIVRARLIKKQNKLNQ